MNIKSYIVLSISTCVSCSVMATQSITSCDQLLSIPHLTTENYALTQDIDCNGYTQDKAVNFKGILDGQNHNITGLKINYDSNYVGLFSQVINARISNLNLNNVTIPFNSGNTAIGLIAGNAINGSSFYNVNIHNSSIQAYESVSTGLGLLVGYATTKSEFTDISINNSQILTTDKTKHIGGLIGSMDDISLVHAAINNNEIGVTTQLNGRVTIGGAIGSMKESRASYIISNNNRIIAPDMTKGYASKLIGSMNESRLSDSTTHDYAEFPLIGRHWHPAIVVGFISKPFKKIPTLQNITTTANEGTLGWFNSKKEVLTKNLIKEI